MLRLPIKIRSFNQMRFSFAAEIEYIVLLFLPNSRSFPHKSQGYPRPRLPLPVSTIKASFARWPAASSWWFRNWKTNIQPGPKLCSCASSTVSSGPSALLRWTQEHLCGSTVSSASISWSGLLWFLYFRGFMPRLCYIVAKAVISELVGDFNAGGM